MSPMSPVHVATTKRSSSSGWYLRRYTRIKDVRVQVNTILSTNSGWINSAHIIITDNRKSLV